MKELIGGLIALVIIVGVVFWAYNNPSGLGSAATSGSTKVNTKVSGFDYNGNTAPGSAGHVAP